MTTCSLSPNPAAIPPVSCIVRAIALEDLVPLTPAASAEVADFRPDNDSNRQRQCRRLHRAPGQAWWLRFDLSKAVKHYRCVPGRGLPQWFRRTRVGEWGYSDPNILLVAVSGFGSQHHRDR